VVAVAFVVGGADVGVDAGVGVDMTGTNGVKVQPVEAKTPYILAHRRYVHRAV